MKTHASAGISKRRDKGIYFTGQELKPLKSYRSEERVKRFVKQTSKEKTEGVEERNKHTEKTNLSDHGGGAP